MRPRSPFERAVARGLVASGGAPVGCLRGRGVDRLGSRGPVAGYALGMATAVGLLAWLLVLILGAPLNAVIAIATGVALQTGRRGGRGVGMAIGSAVWVSVTLLWIGSRSTLTPDQILSGERPTDPALTLVSAIICGAVFGLIVREPGQGMVLRIPTPPPPVTPNGR